MVLLTCVIRTFAEFKQKSTFYGKNNFQRIFLKKCVEKPEAKNSSF